MNYFPRSVNISVNMIIRLCCNAVNLENDAGKARQRQAKDKKHHNNYGICERWMDGGSVNTIDRVSMGWRMRPGTRRTRRGGRVVM